MARREIRIKKAKHVRAFYDAHAFLPLHVSNALMKRFHFRPMHLWPKMMFGVVSIVEEDPVINLAVATNTPCNRFVWIRSVMAEVAVKVTEAVPKIEKRQKEKDDVTPVQNKHDQQDCGEGGQLDVAPKQIGTAALAKFFANGRRILTKNAEENVTPRVLGFAVVAMSVDR